MALHPALLAVKRIIFRAWKEFDGSTTTILAQSSADGGKQWSEARVIASTTGASDHPLLVEHKGAAFLSWLTHEEGYRLLPLPAPAPRAKSAAAIEGR